MQHKQLILLLTIVLLCLMGGNLFSQNRILKKEIESILRGKKAQIGVAVCYDKREMTTVNDRRSYPMLSTFKLPLAMAVLNRLNREQLPLETPIFVALTDLLPNTYSPLRDAKPEGNFDLAIGELLHYSVAQSDNNACDILIKYIGGMDTLQQYIRQLGVKEMILVANEDMMHREAENPYLNHTRPSAAVEVIEKLLTKELFAPVYQKFLEKTLIETTTGSNKLKGGLPLETILGHKTGSSDRNTQGMKIADNDMGFVRLPNGKYYSIAVFVSDSYEDDATNAAIIADVSAAVYRCYIQK